jgi:hypothetical protein
MKKTLRISDKIEYAFIGNDNFTTKEGQEIRTTTIRKIKTHPNGKTFVQQVSWDAKENQIAEWLFVALGEYLNELHLERKENGEHERGN